VVVDVFGVMGEFVEILATVMGNVHVHIHLVDAIKHMGTGKQLLVVMRAGTGR